MAQENEYELIVHQGSRPLWSSFLSAIFFTILVIHILSTIWIFYQYEITEKLCLSTSKSLGFMAFCFAGGVHFSVVKTVLIDLDKDQLISRYCLGPFSYDSKDIIPELEYVAVFKNGKDDFEVNLWYKGNKHYNMYIFELKAQAMEFAEIIVAKLKLDLLDATEKGNSKWVDKLPANE